MEIFKEQYHTVLLAMFKVSTPRDQCTITAVQAQSGTQAHRVQYQFPGSLQWFKLSISEYYEIFHGKQVLS